VQLYDALRDFDLPTMSAMAMAGLQRTYASQILELQVAEIRQAYTDVNNQLEEERKNVAEMCVESAEAQEQLQAQLREAQEAVAEYGKKLEDAEDQKETADKERDAILTDYHALQEELERLRRSSETFTPASRRRTLFDKLPEAVPDVFGMRRRSTMLKQQADGKRNFCQSMSTCIFFQTCMHVQKKMHVS
jgi:chromosome segregation ATPase